MTNTTEAIVLHLDKRKIMQRLHMRMLLLGFPMILALFGGFGLFYWSLPPTKPNLSDTIFFSLPWLVVLEFIVLYAIVTRATKKQTEPAVVISAQGITIHTLWQPVGLLRWEEIADIRVYNFVYRYVGIVPKDMNALCKRLGSRGTVLRLNDWCIRWFYKPLRIFIAPINIPQEYLPISADALMARIGAFETTQL